MITYDYKRSLKKFKHSHQLIYKDIFEGNSFTHVS